ncbi:uncharacterized protein [Procambarus clarkii]|uniref:uncharacterized protein n=1 Tax=Procambarus clarkii TaxID=6728 RepID=UPI003743756B
MSRQILVPLVWSVEPLEADEFLEWGRPSRRPSTTAVQGQPGSQTKRRKTNRSGRSGDRGPSVRRLEPDASVGDASTEGGVRVYRRCLYCNNGDPDVQLLQNFNVYSPDLPWDDLFQESLKDFMGNKMKVVTASVVLPYLDYQRVSETPGTAIVLTDSTDARLIHTFAHKLNFTFNVHEAVNRTWGVETNGTFTGTIGLLQREQMDFSTLTIPTAKRLKAVDFFIAYPADSLSITSLKPSLLPKYLALIRPFEGTNLYNL